MEFLPIISARKIYIFFTLQNKQMKKISTKQKCDEHERFTRSKFTIHMQIKFISISLSFWVCCSARSYKREDMLQWDCNWKFNKNYQPDIRTNKQTRIAPDWKADFFLKYPVKMAKPFQFNSIHFNAIFYSCYPFKCSYMHLFRRTIH